MTHKAVADVRERAIINQTAVMGFWRLGFDTSDIARILKMSEGDVGNAVAAARDGERLWGRETKMPTVESKPVKIRAKVEHRYDRFIWVNVKGQSIWLPRKLVEENRDGTLTMPDWLAKERGLL
jgi:hypothetical protein